MNFLAGCPGPPVALTLQGRLPACLPIEDPSLAPNPCAGHRSSGLQPERPRCDHLLPSALVTLQAVEPSPALGKWFSLSHSLTGSLEHQKQVPEDPKGLPLRLPRAGLRVVLQMLLLLAREARGHFAEAQSELEPRAGSLAWSDVGRNCRLGQLWLHCHPWCPQSCWRPAPLACCFEVLAWGR